MLWLPRQPRDPARPHVQHVWDSSQMVESGWDPLQGWSEEASVGDTRAGGRWWLPKKHESHPQGLGTNMKSKAWEPGFGPTNGPKSFRFTKPLFSSVDQEWLILSGPM